MTAIWYVKMTAKEGQEERVRAGLLKLLPYTRAERGCLVFEVHADVDDPRKFSIYEQWTDLDSHAAHQQTDHFREVAQGEVMDHCEPLEVLDLELVS